MPAGGSLKEVRSGVWRSRVLVGYVDGDKTRPKQHAETYGTTTQPIGKREAERLHAAHVKGATDQKLSTSKDTLGGHLTRWLDDMSADWKPSTEYRNRRIVEAIPDELKSRKLRDLKPADLQRYYSTLSRAGRRRVHAVIRKSLGDAVKGGEVGLAVNPADNLTMPVTTVPEATPPTDEQLTAILRTARTRKDGELWRDLFMFSAFTGLRDGEVCALRWQDVPEDLSEVHVCHSVEAGTKAQLGGKTWKLGGTKTHQDRVVLLSDRARRSLIRRRDAAGGSPTGDEWIFTKQAGNTDEPLHPHHVSRVFGKVTDAAGCPDVTLKDLRSYAATVVTDAAGLKAAQQMLGHRDVTTTARHYASTRADTFKRAAAALDAVAVEDDDQPSLSA